MSAWTTQINSATPQGQNLNIGVTYYLASPQPPTPYLKPLELSRTTTCPLRTLSPLEALVGTLELTVRMVGEIADGNFQRLRLRAVLAILC